MPKLSSINLSAKVPLYEAMEASTRGVRLARNRTSAQIKAVCEWLEPGMPMETRSRIREMLMREVDIAHDSIDISNFFAPEVQGSVAERHPVAPPEEMCARLLGSGKTFYEMLIEAAQWGADQELQACCDWLAKVRNGILAAELQQWRRPKPLSQAEKALAAVDKISRQCGYSGNLQEGSYDVIKAALKRLQELEAAAHSKE